MSLSAAVLQDPRIFEAYTNNHRAIGLHEPQSIAVARIQAALRRLGFPLPRSGAGGLLDGIYGNETRAAVVTFQRRERLKDDGWVGRLTLDKMDGLLRGLPPVPPPPVPTPAIDFGAALARTDAPGALQRARRGHAAIDECRLVIIHNALLTPFDGDQSKDFNLITLAALRAHFRLDVPDDDNSVVGGTRPVELEDLQLISTIYAGIERTLGNPASFVDGTPRDKNGQGVVAAAPIRGPIQVSTLYRNFDGSSQRIGPKSRMAVLIHEATHVIDIESGKDGITHISEFDPAYERQPAKFAMHNPSSYASFAAHIFEGRDPNPRYGLGAGRFL